MVASAIVAAADALGTAESLPRLQLSATALSFYTLRVETQRGDSSTAQPTVFARRWSVLGLIHRGVDCEVWRVADRLNPGIEGALKRAPGFAAESGRAARLAAEFRLLRGITHPGLPRALDYTVDVGEGCTGLVTELVPGRPLDQLGPVGAMEVAAIAADVLRALGHLHALGVLHLDVKPANILHDATNARSVLIDLDLAAIAAGARGHGTAPFAAPEVMSGEDEPDARADLFSLGVTFAGLLRGVWPAGPLPATDQDPGEDQPEWIRTFVRRMTAADPDARPRSARDALRLLRSCGVRLPLETAATREQVLSSPRLVGRRAELGALLAAVPMRRERRPAPPVALVHGALGLGKTRLVEEGITHWQLAGARVLRIQPESGTSTTLGAVQTLLRQLELLAEPSSNAARELELHGDRLGLMDRFSAEVLRRVRVRRTILVFEDVHELDPASRVFVLHLLRRVAHETWEARGRSPCELVITTHLPELRDDALRAWFEGSGRAGLMAEIELKPLEGKACAALVRRMVAPEMVRRNALDFLHDATGGVPLFVRETLLAHPLNPSGNGTLLGSIARRFPSRDEIPASLDAVVRQRLGLVPSQQRACLRRLALVNAPLTAAHAHVLGVAPSALGPLIAAGFLVAHGATHHFVDDTTRRVLAAELERDTARTLHDALASDLSERNAPQHLVLEHRLQGRDAAWAAQEAHMLLPRVLAEGREEEAGRLLELVLRAPGASAFIVRAARLRLVDLCLQRGHLRRGHSLLVEALEVAPNGDPGAMRRRSALHAREGNLPAARADLDALALANSYQSPLDQLSVAVDHAELLFQAGRAGEARDVLAVAEVLVEERFPLARLRERVSEADAPRGIRFRWPGDGAAVIARWLLLMGDIQRGDKDFDGAFRCFMAAMKLHARLGDPLGQGRVLHGLGTLHLSMGRQDEAERFLRRALALRQQIGDLSGAADSANNLGVLLRKLGRAAEAIDEFRESLRIRKQIGHVAGEAFSCINIANVHVERRDLQAAERYLRRALDVSRRLGDVRSQAQVLNNLGAVHHMRDRPLHALRCYREAEALDRSVGNIAGALLKRLNMAQEYTRVGVLDRAARILTVVQRVLRHRGDPEALRQTAFTAARLDMARGDAEHALEVLEGLVADPSPDADFAAEVAVEAAKAGLAANNPRKALALLPLQVEGLSPEARIRVDLVRAQALLHEQSPSMGLVLTPLVEGERFALRVRMPLLAHECAFTEARIRTQLGDTALAQGAWLRACDALEGVLAGMGYGVALKAFLGTPLVQCFAVAVNAFAEQVRPNTAARLAVPAADMLRQLRTTLLEAGYRGDGRTRAPRRIDEALTRVLQLGRTLRSTGAPEDLLREAVDGVVAYCRAERGYLITVDDRGRQRIRMARTRDRENIADPFQELSRGIVNRVVETGRGVRIENAAAEAGFATRESVVNLELRSVLCAPMLHNARVTGVIYVDHRSRVGHFDDGDLELLDLFATQVAIALENARLVREFTRDEKIRVLGSLAGGLAHEFNNLLTGIIGWAQTLQKPEARADLDHGLSTILKAALDGAATVKRLQDYTRVRKETEFEAMDIVEVVLSCVEFTRTSWEGDALRSGHPISLHTELEPGLHALGNPSEIREVVRNLIINSVHAMPRGGSIIIRARSEGERAIISVEDNGVGMTEEVRESIFDPYFTTKGKAGTGLGMSIVYNIIMRHHGALRVDSAPGEGTRIHMEVPRCEAPSHDVGVADLAGCTPQDATILVVDDEPSIVELLCGVLTRAGFKVHAAHDGAAAVALLEKLRFDLVLTDLGMVPVTGWDVARRARQCHPGIAVALVTGWASEIDPQGTRRQSVDRVITKPFDLDRVVATVRELLAQKKQPPEAQ